MPATRLALYLTDNTFRVWSQLAPCYHWKLIQHQQLMDGLGAYIVLMPSVIIIDLTSSVGREAHKHIMNVLNDAPQSNIVLIIIGRQTFIGQKGRVLHIEIPAECQSEAFIIQMLKRAAQSVAGDNSFSQSALQTIVVDS